MIIQSVQSKHRPPRIMLVEDNPGDVVLMKRTIGRTIKDCEIKIAENGEDALMFLDDIKVNKTAFIPDIILLDLNLPKINGLVVLQTIKSDEVLCSIPVIMLTSSSAERDVFMCYANYANGYVEKPTGGNNYDQLIRSLSKFWFQKAILPDLEEKIAISDDSHLATECVTGNQSEGGQGCNL